MDQVGGHYDQSRGVSIHCRLHRRREQQHKTQHHADAKKDQKSVHPHRLAASDRRNRRGGVRPRFKTFGVIHSGSPTIFPFSSAPRRLTPRSGATPRRRYVPNGWHRRLTYISLRASRATAFPRFVRCRAARYNHFGVQVLIMPRRLARKLMLSITVIVIIVAAVSGLVNVKPEERQLLNTMKLGADQLSKAITSATWHAMLDDHREAAYQVMQTIALKQGIDRIRMFNRTGEVMFSTNPEDRAGTAETMPESKPPDLPSRVRIFRGANGGRRLAMATPIYNEPSCSQAQCHAHPAEMKVLGVLDLRLNLENVDHEVSGMKFRVLLVTAVEVTLISLFIIYFTRRFLSRPIDKLIEGTKAVSQMELDEPLDIVGSSEELDELARSFDVMRDRLRTALGEINQFTLNLETKVEERTQQLKAAQRKLLQSDRR